MKIGEIQEYGYSDGKRGVEAQYLLDEDMVLHVRIVGSNHWRDYAGNLLAWPRVRPWKSSRIKFHPIWHRMAEAFANLLIAEMSGHEVKEIRLMGHSMGGAVAAIMLFYLPAGIPRQAILINAPKIGNASSSRWLWGDFMCGYSLITALYDRGDIVRRLPFFYCRYPFNRPYTAKKTRPFWKAHVNLPDEWGSFFDGVQNQ